MTNKEKLQHLKKMVRDWNNEGRPFSLSMSIAMFLFANLDLDDKEKPELLSENDDVKVYKIDNKTIFKEESK